MSIVFLLLDGFDPILKLFFHLKLIWILQWFFLCRFNLSLYLRVAVDQACRLLNSQLLPFFAFTINRPFLGCCLDQIVVDPVAGCLELIFPIRFFNRCTVYFFGFVKSKNHFKPILDKIIKIKSTFSFIWRLTIKLI